RQPAAQADPEPPGLREQGADRGDAAELPDLRAQEVAARHQAREPVVGAYPDRAGVGVRDQRPDRGIRQALLGAVAARPAVPDPAQAVGEAAQPEVALAVLEGIEQVEQSIAAR